jgi:hypothetical protein
MMPVIFVWSSSQFMRFIRASIVDMTMFEAAILCRREGGSGGCWQREGGSGRRCRSEGGSGGRCRGVISSEMYLVCVC